VFQDLSKNLSSVFRKLGGKGLLTEADVDDALRAVRTALLQADVALPVVKDFLAKAREAAVGENVLRAVKPDQQVIKIVNDLLIELLGGTTTEINLNATPPVVILMAGLQGSGKTTTSAKLAKFLADKKNKKTLLASLDIYRPAAQEQLRVLAEQINGHALPIVAGEKPEVITHRAMDTARKEGFDVLILDTAGRLSIDDALMAELAAVKKLAAPTEILLVADSLTGQDAVNTAQIFHDKIGITGLILTRLDGDGRGGAALSMRHVTGQPIKFAGIGEKLDGLEIFDPARIAGRILDMGDVVALVEKATEAMDMAEAETMAAAVMKGQMDLEMLKSQFKTMKKMGGFAGIMGMLPGMGQMGDMLKGQKIDDRLIDRQIGIINSMTPAERRDPDVIKARRKIRIAAGSGVDVQQVNQLLKQFYTMRDAMKKLKRMGGEKGLKRHGMGALFQQNRR
jgi:signal recognition particle subunit SRP54